MKCNEFKEKVADLFDKTIDMQTQAQLSEHMKSVRHIMRSFARPLTCSSLEK